MEVFHSLTHWYWIYLEDFLQVKGNLVPYSKTLSPAPMKQAGVAPLSYEESERERKEGRFKGEERRENLQEKRASGRSISNFFCTKGHAAAWPRINNLSREFPKPACRFQENSPCRPLSISQSYFVQSLKMKDLERFISAYFCLLLIACLSGVNCRVLILRASSCNVRINLILNP